MKAAIPSAAKDGQNPTKSSHAAFSSPQSGRLAQLAAMMNQSPRVQAQFKLADEIRNSGRVQKQISLAAEINHQARVAQPGSLSRAGFARDGVEVPSPVSSLGVIENRSKTGTMPGVAAQRQPSETTAQREEAATPNRTGLPDQLKSGVENLSGLSLDDVKVHYNSDKPAQLNALAYAQGKDIHVAPGQEKHLSHEAWHIVQQAQGRVRPTMQMKAGVPVNDDAALEHEADVMGERAEQIRLSGHAQAERSNRMSGAVQEKSAAGTTQLLLDADSMLPAEEQGGIDNMLRHNGHDPDLYTAGDYQVVRDLYSTLLGHHTTIAKKLPGGGAKKREANEKKRAARVAIPGAYQGVRNSATNLELRAGTAAWNAAVTAGADAYVANRAGGYAAAAGGAWPGRGAMPGAFQNAVQAEVNRRDQIVENAFQAYQNDGRLLAGTIVAIKANMGPFPTLAAVNARLLTVYQRQTEVSRENWLIHLGIAGRNTVGSASLHYTTFNDAVSNPVAGRVDNQSVQQLMDMLFDLPAGDQIHATVVIGGTRYRKYYGGNYSLVPPVKRDKDQLDGKYNEMIAAMTARVRAAKDAHGRVGNNDRAQRLAIGP